MISKRRKTKTIRKNQRKRSNRVRRLHRMKMRGGVFPNDAIPLTQFKHSDTGEHFPKSSYYITPNTLQSRIGYLQRYKRDLDTLLNKGTDNETQYTHDLFKEGVFDRIEKDIKEKIRLFQKHSPYTYDDDRFFRVVSQGFILPILNEYLAAGFTPEELLRAELDDITITAILNEIVPAIDNSTPLTNVRQSKSMRAKISVYGYNDTFLVSARIPQDVINEKNPWTEVHTNLLKQKIRDTILTALIAAKISTPAQLINLGFSLEELNAKTIEYDLSKLKNVSIEKLLDAGFSLDKLKVAEFTANDFRNNGYNLKQLIEFKFKMKDFEESKIKFTDDDFPVNGDLDAEVFKTEDFTFLDVYNLKLGTYNKQEKEDDEDGRVRFLKFRVNILQYLKSIHVRAQDLKDSDIFIFPEKSAVINLILAGFNYADIQAVKPPIENDEIYKILREIVGPRSILQEFKDCRNLKFSYKDLKDIGFLPMEISTINNIRNFEVKKQDLEDIKSAGFTVLDFQMEPIENLINNMRAAKVTFNETPFKANTVRNVPMEYTKKHFKPSDMYDAGFKLQDLIRTQELEEENKKFTNLGLGPEYRLEYELKDLMLTYKREFIDPNPPACNIAKIFETGLYTYGEIRQVVEAYERKGDWYTNDANIKSAIDDTRSYINIIIGKDVYDANLDSIKTLLTKMKNEIITDDTGKQAPMCQRTGGLGGLFGRNGTTDDNCRYKKQSTVAPVAAN